jgi:hypothetical protein
MTFADPVWFSTAARRVAEEARGGGLPVVPGFRSPPRQEAVSRSIRRLPGQQAIVAVRLTGRDKAEVAADLVEGVVVANRLIGPDAQRWRRRLHAAVAGGTTDTATRGGSTDTATRGGSTDTATAA